MSTPGVELDAETRRALRIRRRESRLHAWQVAVKVGVAERTLRDWERGKHRPGTAHYLAWLEALGLRENANGELEWKE